MTDKNDALRLARECAEKMYADDPASRELGIVVTIPEPGHAIAAMTVTAGMINGHSVCHGGFIFTLADTAFAFACNAYDRVSLAASASIEFLEPARVGDRLEAHAAERQRGHRSGTYDVSVRGAAGQLVALFRGRCVSQDRKLLDAAL